MAERALRLSALGLVLCVSACQSAPAPRVVRVAVCQIEVGPSAAQNLERIERAMRDAAAAGAELACLPEACVHGWVNPAAHREAARVPGPTTERLGALARELELHVVLGAAERDGPELYNAALLIGSDGRVLLRHRKIHVLRELMDPPYSAGDAAQRSVVETSFGRVGMMICADTFREDLVAALAAQSPELVVVPYGWAAPEQSWPEHGETLAPWVQRLARACDAPVVGVDSTGRLVAGPWKGFVLGGQSVVCDAGGAVRDILPDRATAMRLYEFTLRRKRVAGE